jgi:transketolase
MQLNHEPAALVLTRQAVPTFDRTKYASASGVAEGAYILADAAGGKPQVILIATGSEVSICIDAYEKLKTEGIKARVVSMPSWDIFEHQSREYREQVLPPEVKARVAVEQASTFGWSQYVGQEGIVLAMHTFGASAPLKELQKKFGFMPEKVIEAARKLVKRS